MYFKTKRQIQGRKVWLSRVKNKQKELNKSCLLPNGQDSTLPASTFVHNLTEPLLEVFKEESLPVVPTDKRQPLNEVLLVIEEPKPEPTNPTGSDPIPDFPLFCSLCLRPCTSGQVVEFYAEPSWNSLDVASGQAKLALLLGLELELDQCAICRSCWTMVETLEGFREGCLKAAAWKARFSFGLDEVGDDWLSKEQVEAMEWTRKVVQEHMERIEMAEVEARNRQESGAYELPEEKPMIKDEPDWTDDASYLNLPEEAPKNDFPAEPAEFAEKMEITAFSCAKCQRKFETKAGLGIHYSHCKKPAKKQPLASKLYTCSVCPANFTEGFRLEEHLNKHLGNKPYVCRKENCNKRLYGIRERRNHERKCKGNNTNIGEHSETLEVNTAIVQKKQKTPSYSCKNCPRMFSTEGGLKTHASRCNEPVKDRRLHTCEICSMDFLNSLNLEAHMNKHNGIKPYKCTNESCGKHFHGKPELRRHRELCGKDKPICSLCGLQLYSASSLRAHMATHAEVPTVECATCGKMFKSKKNLTKHQTTHSDERNYPCSECGKAFKSSYALTVHRRIHTQEKPFGCTACEQRFAYKCLVKPHMDKCHAGEG